MKSSESIKSLCDSLVKAQKKIKNLYPSSRGYGYDYVPLEKIIDMLKEVLPEFGLSYIQLPFGGQSGQTVGLTTRIIHESGEWLEETAEFPVTDMKGVNATQKAGAAITYFRRYALLSAFGVTGDKDVDANDKAFDNKKPADSEELVNQTMELESYIGDGKLQGQFLEKAKSYIKTKNLEGIKRTNEWCRNQKSA
jgi:hypothetical protein